MFTENLPCNTGRRKTGSKDQARYTPQWFSEGIVAERLRTCAASNGSPSDLHRARPVVSASQRLQNLPVKPVQSGFRIPGIVCIDDITTLIVAKRFEAAMDTLDDSNILGVELIGE